MNDIIQAMETRRSIRQFKPDMPRREELQQIIEAGLYAANGRGRQGAIILAVSNRELRDKLSALNREIGGFPEGKDPFYGAPAVLIVLADKSCPTGIYDGSLVMGNLMLAAHALGLAVSGFTAPRRSSSARSTSSCSKTSASRANGKASATASSVPSTAKPRSPHPAGTAGCSGPNKQAQKRNGIPDGVPFLFVLNLPRRRCPASRHWQPNTSRGCADR